MEDELVALGFSNFVNNKLHQTYSNNRKSRTEIYKNRFITFQVIFIEGEWSVEEIFFDIENSTSCLDALFGNPYSICRVIDFIRQLQT